MISIQDLYAAPERLPLRLLDMLLEAATPCVREVVARA